MSINTLKDLFVNRLHDIYDAEKQVSEIMPALTLAAGNQELKTLFSAESDGAREQVSRLEEIYREIGVSDDSVKSDGMRGIIREGVELMQEAGDPAVKDAALISIAREMKHYEMATYGSMRTWAREMEYPDIADLLQDTLDEEGDTDRKLTKLAEGGMFSKGLNEKAPK
jgi:ferritin-like metal-binding protein YciE